MPTKVNVKINTVQHTSQLSKAGNELNYVEITGFDATNNKGFKKRFFATKKDGTATKNAETADALNQDDWAEITLDDTSYHNVQTLKKISEPAGMSAPSQAQTQTSTGGGGRASGGSSDKMTKADWAAKDRAKEQSMARHKGLVVAADVCVANGNFDPDEIILVARTFADYLSEGTGQVVDGEKRETLANGNTLVNAPQQNDDPGVQDDDIPF